MKRILFATLLSVAAAAGLSACSDSNTDNTNTQSIDSGDGAAPGGAAVDNDTQIITPRPQSGSGGDLPAGADDAPAVAPSGAEPAPAN